MNQTTFSTLLKDNKTLSQEDTLDLDNIIQEFPYFQAARAIQLKGLKTIESFKYNQALKTTAAYTTNRSILFDYITSKEFQQHHISKTIQENNKQINDLEIQYEDISTPKTTTSHTSLEQQLATSKDILNPDLFVPANNNQTETNQEPEAETTQEDITPEKTLNLGKPLNFDKTETHSFNEWLNITKFKPIEREEKPAPKSNTKASKSKLSRSKKFELIEQFISKNPKIKPANNPLSNQNIAKKQMIQPEALMTETLARIYLEQNNYKKAIQSYKILSLKYPEKSGFFADQIKAIIKIQEQNKTK